MKNDADYIFLRQTRELLLPGLYNNREHHSLCRELRFERVVPGDQELTLVSFNGYDRRERAAVIPLKDLRKDLAGAFNKAVKTVLSLQGTARVYFVHAAAKEVLAGMDIHGRGVEYDVWIDHVTDNVIIKGYRRLPRRAAMGFAVTRSIAESGDDKVAEFVRKTVTEMAETFRDEVKLAELGAFIEEGGSMRIFYGAAQ